MLLNNGNGTFANHTEYVAGHSIALGDMDGEEDLDLVVCLEAAIGVLRNFGDGTFSVPAPELVGSNPSYVEVADVDGDGDLDLALADPGFEDLVTVGFNNGNALFASPMTYPVGIDPCALTFADVDDDGDVDLSFAISPTLISIMLNNASGSLSDPILYGVGRIPDGIKFGDLDVDGDLDLAVTNRNHESVSVLLNQYTPND